MWVFRRRKLGSSFSTRPRKGGSTTENYKINIDHGYFLCKIQIRAHFDKNSKSIIWGERVSFVIIKKIKKKKKKKRSFGDSKTKKGPVSDIELEKRLSVWPINPNVTEHTTQSVRVWCNPRLFGKKVDQDSKQNRRPLGACDLMWLFVIVKLIDR